MVPRRHIADVDPLHATFAQSFQFFGVVDVMRDQLTVDLEAYSIEAQLIPFSQRDKNRDLCARRIQEFFLKLVQLRRNA